MDGFSLINKIRPHKEELLNNQAKISDFLILVKRDSYKISGNISDNIIDKISHIHIPINNIHEKIALKITTIGELSIKTVILGNNNFVMLHAIAKFINHIWRLNLCQKYIY